MRTHLSIPASLPAKSSALAAPSREIFDWHGLSIEAKARLKTAIVDGLLALANDDPVLAHALPLRGRAALANRLVDRFGTDTCAQVPGFYLAERGGRRWWSLAGAAGLLIPVRNLDGHIACLKVRADDPGAGPKYTTMSSAKHGGPSPGAPVHVPVHALPRGDLVRVTEGELKADIATVISGVLTLSIPGVSAWRAALAVLEMLQARRVLLAFDMDWQANPHVARALAQTTEALVEAGYNVVVEAWDVSQGKGIDDVLVSGCTPALQSAVPWLHKARTFPEKSGRGP